VSVGSKVHIMSPLGLLRVNQRATYECSLAQLPSTCHGAWIGQSHGLTALLIRDLTQPPFIDSRAGLNTSIELISLVSVSYIISSNKNNPFQIF
jgi:hypothetical protein